MNKVFLFLLVMAVATAQVAFAQPAFAAAKAPASKTVKKTPASKAPSKPKSAKTAPVSKPASSPKPAEEEVPKKDPAPDLEEPVSPVVEPEPEPEPEAQKTDNDSSEDETAKAESSEDDEHSNETAKVGRNEDEIRFGVRANFGVSEVFPNTFASISNGQKVDVFAEGGIAGGLSGFAIIPISSFHFVPEICVQYRKPINIDNPAALPTTGYLNVTEVAIEVPLMFRFLYSEDNLIYLGAGLFGGIVLNLTEDPPSIDDGIKKHRSLDYGLALELGFRINENFSIDVRGTASAASYGIGEYLDSGDTPRLIQAQLGVSYVF